MLFLILQFILFSTAFAQQDALRKMGLTNITKLTVFQIPIQRKAADVGGNTTPHYQQQHLIIG